MSTYSLNVQKQSEAGNLFLAIVQNGKILDSVSTKAAYGIASLTGNCGESENIDVNQLKTPTQTQREEKEAAQRAIEEENQRLKEAGFRQTNNS